MDILIIISAVVGVVYFVTFLNIAARLAAIRDEAIKLNLKISDLSKQLGLEKARLDYYTNRSFGKNQDALENLTSVIFSQLIPAGLNKEQRKAKYEDLKKLHSETFIELGGTFPEYPFYL